ADVEEDDSRRAWIDQRRAAGRRQQRLGLAVDDLEREPKLLRGAGAELGTIDGGTAGLGGDEAGAGDALVVHLVAADGKRLERARDRGVAQPAGGRDTLAEADDSREGVDDAEAVAARARDQEPAVVGAKVEGRIGGAAAVGTRGRPLKRPIPARSPFGRPRGIEAEAGPVSHFKSIPPRRSILCSQTAAALLFLSIGPKFNRGTGPRNPALPCVFLSYRAASFISRGRARFLPSPACGRGCRARSASRERASQFRAPLPPRIRSAPSPRFAGRGKQPQRLRQSVTRPYPRILASPHGPTHPGSRSGGHQVWYRTTGATRRRPDAGPRRRALHRRRQLARPGLCGDGALDAGPWRDPWDRHRGGEGNARRARGLHRRRPHRLWRHEMRAAAEA